MTVPSERDAFRKWRDSRSVRELNAAASWDIFEAGFRAALEAQHTRDEEARCLLGELAKRMRANSERWFPQLHASDVDLRVFYGLGLVGESGEVANVVKKWLRGERLPIGDELADVFTYLLLLADDCGVDLIAEYEAKVEVNEERWGRAWVSRSDKGATRDE